MKSNFKIIEINKRLFPIASTVLADAFKNNKMFDYFYKTHKVRKLKIHFNFLLHFYSNQILKGIIDDDNQLVGVAILLKPGHEYVKSLFLGIKLIFQVGIASFIRMLKYTDEEDKYLEEDSFLLFYIGISPKYQNKGFGSALISACLKEVGNNPVMLSTIDSETVAIYKKNGFRVVSEHKIFGFHTWFMKNESGNTNKDEIL